MISRSQTTGPTAGGTRSGCCCGTRCLIRVEARGQSAGAQGGALWAYVLKLRSQGTRSWQFLGGLLYHALQPTLGMLYAEAAGHTSYRSTWMCVTDGGHYDNLGLVEALQRAPELGITHVLVLDASGDKADTWFTLGGSIALARSDAGTDIALNPTEMTTPPESGNSATCPGQWFNRGLAARSPARTRIRTRRSWVCKLGWWASAPWDVRAYAAGHPAYPTDSTLEQLYDSRNWTPTESWEPPRSSWRCRRAAYPQPLPPEGRHRSDELQ